MWFPRMAAWDILPGFVAWLPRSGTSHRGGDAIGIQGERIFQNHLKLVALVKNNVASALASKDKRGRKDRAHDSQADARHLDRKSTRLNSSHSQISYAVFCLQTKTILDLVIEF